MTSPQIAMNPTTGAFAATVVYAIDEIDPMFPIHERSTIVTQYLANGALVSRQYVTAYDVSESTPRRPFRPAIATGGVGKFLVTYTSLTAFDPKDGIFGRRGTI